MNEPSMWLSEKDAGESLRVDQKTLEILREKGSELRTTDLRTGVKVRI